MVEETEGAEGKHGSEGAGEGGVRVGQRCGEEADEAAQTHPLREPPVRSTMRNTTLFIITT